MKWATRRSMGCKWDLMARQTSRSCHSTRLRSVHQMSSIFTWFSSSWPKTTYLKGPLCVPEIRWWRNMKNTKNRGCCESSEENQRGNRCRSRLGPPLLLHQHLLLALHHERGEVHPLDYGFLVITWSYLSMYCNCGSTYDVPCMIMELSM
jgi:hypothetical protein